MLKSVSFNNEKRFGPLHLFVYFLGLLFFLNCFTPLRIHFDMLRYFAIKDCWESNCPPHADIHDYLPYGYTLLLLLLSKLRILHSFTIVFLNCLFLLFSLFFVKKIFRITGSCLFFLLIVLLNWTTIKFVIHPLSELQYIFFSCASLYAFQRYIAENTFRHLIIAFVLSGLAFLTRTVGVTLIAAILISVIWSYRVHIATLISKNKRLLVFVVLILLLVAVFSSQLGLHHYMMVFFKQFTEGVSISNVIGWHLAEWGEIWINASRLKILPFLPSPFGLWIFIAAGSLSVCGFTYICFSPKNNIPFIVKIYLLLYLLLMFIWPFPDPRFWLPVIPLMAGVIAQTSLPESRWLRIIAGIYKTVYCILGLISLGYITYTSFNHQELAKTQAKGVYRNEYELHFYGKTLSDTARQADSSLVFFLNKYDK